MTSVVLIVPFAAQQSYSAVPDALLRTLPYRYQKQHRSSPNRLCLPILSVESKQSVLPYRQPRQAWRYHVKGLRPSREEQLLGSPLSAVTGSLPCSQYRSNETQARRKGSSTWEEGLLTRWKVCHEALGTLSTLASSGSRREHLTKPKTIRTGSVAVEPTLWE
jgi:hypothetical protein